MTVFDFSFSKLDLIYNLHLEVDSLVERALDYAPPIETHTKIDEGMNKVLDALDNLREICNAYINPQRSKGSTD